MKINIMITKDNLIIEGIDVKGIFEVAACILVSSIIGIIYGTVKKNRQFVKWSVTALVIDLICIVLFYVGLAGGM